jgi:hypothetical protein
MARNQGRKVQQKSIFFLIFGPILLAAMHQALIIYLSSLSLSGQLFSFFLRVMQEGEAQKPNSFFRASPPPTLDGLWLIWIQLSAARRRHQATNKRFAEMALGTAPRRLLCRSLRQLDMI